MQTPLPDASAYLVYEPRFMNPSQVTPNSIKEEFFHGYGTRK